jgi:CRP-like cAMP-binding protein
MKALDLPQGMLLLEAGAQVETVIFPHAGIISLVAGLATGEIIEIGMIGRESALGASAVLNGGISLNRAIVQIAGTALGFPPSTASARKR